MNQHTCVCRNIYNAPTFYTDGVTNRVVEGVVIFDPTVGRLVNTGLPISGFAQQYVNIVALAGIATTNIRDIVPGTYLVQVIGGTFGFPTASFMISRRDAPGTQSISDVISIPATGDAACFLRLVWADTPATLPTKPTTLQLRKETATADGNYKVVILRSDVLP